MSKAEKKFLDFVNEKSEYNPNYDSLQGKLSHCEEVMILSQPQGKKIQLWNLLLTRVFPLCLIMGIIIGGSITIAKSITPITTPSDKEFSPLENDEYHGELIDDIIDNYMSPNSENLNNKTLQEAMYTAGLYLYELDYLNTSTDQLLGAYLDQAVINSINYDHEIRQNSGDDNVIKQFYQMLKKQPELASKIKWYQFDKSANLPTNIDEYYASGIYLVRNVKVNKELITNNCVDTLVPYLDELKYINHDEYLIPILEDTKNGTYIEILNERLIDKDLTKINSLNQYIVSPSHNNYIIDNNLVKIVNDNPIVDSAVILGNATLLPAKLSSNEDVYYYDKVMAVLNSEVLTYRTIKEIEFTSKAVTLPVNNVNTDADPTWNKKTATVYNTSQLLEYVEVNKFESVQAIFPLTIKPSPSSSSINSSLDEAFITNKIILINAEKQDLKGFYGDDLNVYRVYEKNGVLNVILTYSETTEIKEINKYFSLAVSFDVDTSNINVIVVNANNAVEMAEVNKTGFE